jgi:site-specific recombinase XerD
MQDYKNAVEIIMDYLDKNQYCHSLIEANRSCFEHLEVYLLRKEVDYLPQYADEWYESVFEGLSKSYKSHYRVTLLRLQDVYETGDIRLEHQTRHLKSYTILNRYWKSALDEYLIYQNDYLAPATINNHKHQCARFFIFLQQNNVQNISEITYALITRFYKEDIHSGRWGKGQLDRCITILMNYLFEKGSVPYGFTIILHYLTFKKETFWNGVAQDVHEKIKRITRSLPTVPVCQLHDYQTISEKEHSKNEYSRSVISAYRRAVDLLILFLDIHGYTYNPELAMLWFTSIRHLCGTESSTIRRSLCLIATYHESAELSMYSVFREKKRAFDLIPEWSKEFAYKYVDNKIKEGWALSTLDMIRSSLSRFCNYLDQLGVRSFMELESSHIKQFNLQDVHKTPAGKNAYNVRIRKFLLYLGLNGHLSNPMLFVSLPCVNAPKETIVVILTEAEMNRLNQELHTDESGLSLRKKAMLLLGLKMGLRSSDIAKLTFEEVDWNNASLCFIQAKTEVEVNLPMPTEVGNALFRYIKEERHQKDNPCIFLSEKAPYKPVGRSTCNRALDSALPDRNVSGSGFHVTRKTYATSLLRNGVGADLVADALGQHGTASVHRYLSLDTDRMQMCALSLNDCGIGRWNNGQ